jgi:hypothetical protein
MNREYQKRATRQGIRSFLAQEFYRPALRPDPRPKRKSLVIAKHEQLALNFNPGPMHFSSDQLCPLADVFPEAYE